MIQDVKIFTDFPWDEVFGMYRDELVRFHAALAGNNMYYGFAQDLSSNDVQNTRSHYSPAFVVMILGH